MAKKTILICDQCLKEVEPNKGGVLRINFTDARRGTIQADVCDDCAATVSGQKVGRRGRRPKALEPVPA